MAQAGVSANAAHNLFYLVSGGYVQRAMGRYRYELCCTARQENYKLRQTFARHFVQAMTL
jgi:hypothetical protein